MEGPDPSKIPLPKPCWACGRVLDPQDRYCRYCGKGQGGSSTWYYKHWGIILLLAALGPFALYFVWRSPVISRGAKLAYAAAGIAITLYLAHALYTIWNFYTAFLNTGPNLGY